MVLIPQHQMELLKSSDAPRRTLREAVQNDLDEKMRAILSDSHADVYNKAQRYSSVLQRFLALVRQEERENAMPSIPPPPATVASLEAPPMGSAAPSGENQRITDSIYAEIMQNIPKNSRTKARYILEKMAASPHIASWNAEGELILDKRRIPGTHLYDLIKNVTSAQIVSDSRRPSGWKEYLHALSKLNIPISLISNPSARSLLENLKTGHYAVASKAKTYGKPRKTRARKTPKIWDETQWLTF